MPKQVEEVIAEKRIAADILIAAFKTPSGPLLIDDNNPRAANMQAKIIADAYKVILKAVSSSA